MASLAIAALLAFAAGVPPLSPSQVTRLETARDGRDHQESAFVALVENMAAWNGEIGDAAIRLNPNLERLIAQPAEHRGELCRITGAIQQRTRLAPPHDAVVEWFIRLDAGDPVIVYIAAGLDADAVSWRDGQRVVVAARYYKPVEMIARDGTPRRYAAFVGGFPRLVGAGAAGGVTRLWLVAVPVIVLFVSFLLLLLITRRVRRAKDGPSPSRPILDAEVDDPRPLPEDPAEALAELERRAKE